MAKDKDKDPVAQASLWGGIASSVASLAGTGVNAAGMFNSDIRNSNVAIAEANARAAEANAKSSSSSDKIFGMDKKYVYIGGGVLALIVLALVFTKK